MLVAPVLQAASSVVILTLAASCGRNMLQTRHHFMQKDDSYFSSMFENDATMTDLISSSRNSPLPPELVVQNLRSLKRENLLHIFSKSRSPSNLTEIQGEWDGCLLENNGVIMTLVSKIMTNGLFGFGRKWNGKEFMLDSKGTNRFIVKGISNDGSGKHHSSIDTAHDFDYSITDSVVDNKQETTTSSSVVRLKYSNYHRTLSLWSTMADEVRFIPAGDKQVLIGFGCMEWSGGMLNGAPFCLWRVNPK